tara:strand:- start:284 stop:697 length:414 start_codon:yes stop_codon:yes gene_type:complete
MKTINATKGELVNLINGLFAVQDLKGKKFSLSVSKNIKILQEELKDLETAGKPTKEFLELADRVNIIANEGAEDSQAKILALEEDNKELVESRRKQLEDVTAMMEESASVKLETISESVLPEDITAKQINNIEKIIK